MKSLVRVSVTVTVLCIRCCCFSVLSKFLMVTGSDELISVYVGEDVTLNCSVDSHIPAEDIEEVSWKKRVENEYIMVLLYQNKVTVSEASDEQYIDRVEFFSDEFHRGNFSLRLKRVRTEDKGVYMCQVFAGRLSDNATVTLQQLGFFVIVLFPMFCFLTFSCLNDIEEGQKSCINLLNITLWLIFMFIMMAVMAYFFATSMRNEKDVAGWTCTAVFLQVLWMITMYIGSKEPDVPYRTFLYVFGSVGVVLIMAVALMTELILKTVNGDCAVGDLRTVVYPIEGLFTLTVLIFIMFKPWIASCLQCLQKIQKPADTSANTEQQNQEHQTAVEDHELESLSPASEVTCEQPES